MSVWWQAGEGSPFSFEKTMTKTPYSELVGKKLHRLTVLKWLPPDASYNQSRFVCECDCGKKDYVVRAAYVRNSAVKSCGCQKKKAGIGPTNNLTHGKTYTPEYRIWSSMISRCYNKKEKSYADYGARGVVLCQEWRESFDRFYADMGPRPSPRHTIERIDPKGNYESSNCKWIPRAEQNTNKTNNVFIEFRGQKKTVAEWARVVGIKDGALRWRIRNNWPLEVALCTQDHRSVSRSLSRS